MQFPAGGCLGFLARQEAGRVAGAALPLGPRPSMHPAAPQAEARIGARMPASA